MKTFITTFFLLLSISVVGFVSQTQAKEPAPDQKVWDGKKTSFHGFDQYSFMMDKTACKVVIPKKIADGKPWVWRARFFGHEPQFDIAMLNCGYHVVYCDVAGLYGNTEAVKRWNTFYTYLRFEHLFSDRAILEGMSRGGLIVYNWAAANPDKVAAIYADAPVLDFKSWPKINPTILKVYGFKNEQEAKAYKNNPVDNLAPLAKAGIPIIHVVGMADNVVPVSENTLIAEQRYQKIGGTFKVIRKKGVGHHPHSLKDPSPIVKFVTTKGQGSANLPAEKIVGRKNFIPRGDFMNSRIRFEREKVGHVAFIGGSITEMNGYRPMVCAMLEKRFPQTDFTFTQAGISSTCSDTGAFRLSEDVLSKGPLDMLFVEFAVNDDQDAQLDASDALRGMEGVIAQARSHNPNVDIVMTFFTNQNMLAQLDQGKSPPSIAAHSKVAEHYGISVNNLAQELSDLMKAGKMDWKKYGGVHPNQYGNTMCASMIANSLLDIWSKPIAKNAQSKAHPQVSPLDPFSYVSGRFLDFDQIEIDQSWKKGIPDWPKENKGKVRSRFLGTPFIYANQAGAKLKIKFNGTAIGAYMLSGPDTAIIRCTIDGKESKEIDTLHRHSGFNYPMTVMFFNELSNSGHVLELEIQKNRKGRMREGGEALRVLHFTGN
jgi:lysophospholipase L1-like esterase/dienelactone hydrolase